MNPIFAFGLGPGEMLVVGLIALLLFGKRLPEVARSLGKGVTEFKKGVQGIQDEIQDASRVVEHAELPHPTEPKPPEVPKFEPPSEPATASGSSESAQLGSLDQVDQYRNSTTD